MATKASVLVRAHVRIYGKVQNVGFRFYIHRRAASFGLTGSVGNLDEDAVEIFLQGERHRIEECIEECRHGPLLAQIEKVEVEWQKPLKELNHFELH